MAKAGHAHAHDHGGGHGHGHDHADHGEHHIVPPKTYFLVFIALMVLLILTLGVAMIDLGNLNLLIAMTVAVIKVALIMLFFMHLRWTTNLVRFFAFGVFFWLVIKFVLTLSDYMSRGWHEPNAPRLNSSGVGERLVSADSPAYEVNLPG